MARVAKLKPITSRFEPPKVYKPKAEIKRRPEGILTLINFINENRKPKIIEISKGAKPFKINDSWNFDIPIASLTTNY